MADQPTVTAPSSAAVDVMAILAAQQDQIDELTGAVEARTAPSSSCSSRSGNAEMAARPSGYWRPASAADRARAADRRADKLAAMHSQLHDGIAALRSGEDWRRWLRSLVASLPTVPTTSC